VEQVLAERQALNPSSEPGQHRFVINTDPGVMAQLLTSMGFDQPEIAVIDPA
jgi:hypothetical protein